MPYGVGRVPGLTELPAAGQCPEVVGGNGEREECSLLHFHTKSVNSALEPGLLNPLVSAGHVHFCIWEKPWYENSQPCPAIAGVPKVPHGRESPARGNTQ